MLVMGGGVGIAYRQTRVSWRWTKSFARFCVPLLIFYVLTKWLLQKHTSKLNVKIVPFYSFKWVNTIWRLLSIAEVALWTDQCNGPKVFFLIKVHSFKSGLKTGMMNIDLWCHLLLSSACMFVQPLLNELTKLRITFSLIINLWSTTLVHTHSANGTKIFIKI